MRHDVRLTTAGLGRLTAPGTVRWPTSRSNRPYTARSPRRSSRPWRSMQRRPLFRPCSGIRRSAPPNDANQRTLKSQLSGMTAGTAAVTKSSSSTRAASISAQCLLYGAQCGEQALSLIAEVAEGGGDHLRGTRPRSSVRAARYPWRAPSTAPARTRGRGCTPGEQVDQPGSCRNLPSLRAERFHRERPATGHAGNCLYLSLGNDTKRFSIARTPR